MGLKEHTYPSSGGETSGAQERVGVRRGSRLGNGGPVSLGRRPTKVVTGYHPGCGLVRKRRVSGGPGGQYRTLSVWGSGAEDQTSGVLVDGCRGPPSPTSTPRVSTTLVGGVGVKDP